MNPRNLFLLSPVYIADSQYKMQPNKTKKQQERQLLELEKGENCIRSSILKGSVNFVGRWHTAQGKQAERVEGINTPHSSLSLFPTSDGVQHCLNPDRRQSLGSPIDIDYTCQLPGRRQGEVSRVYLETQMNVFKHMYHAQLSKWFYPEVK